MITSTPEPLPSAAESELREWLIKAPFQTLLRVIDAKQKDAEVKALRDAVQSSKYEAKLESGNSFLRDAQRYQACLDVLKEIAEQANPYTTIKLT